MGSTLYLQIKFEGEGSRPAFSKLEVVFRGMERRDGAEEIELVEQRKVLWGLGAAGSSSFSEGDDSDDFPPSSRFRIDLTQDLPHCIHLPSSSLEYTLSAILSYADPDIPPLVKCAPIHLVRTSAPGSSLLANSPVAASADPPPSTAPQTLSLVEPVALNVRLSGTVFRRSEPIELLVRIEVPSAKAVQEDGLRLRTVSAELVRKVLVGGTESEDELVGAGEGEESRVNGKSVEVASTSDEIEEIAPTLLPQPPAHLTVLARSGKSCRFSPTRPVVIRLLLHHPAVISCESITQVRSPISLSQRF